MQRKLGIHQGFAFDVSAVCSGYLLALSNADNYLKRGQATYALVIGAETFSRVIDMKDRATCVLFGDGAGAVLLKREPLDPSNSPSKQSDVLGINVFSDGRYRELLYADGGPSRTQNSGYLRMEGKEVFRHAVDKMSQSAARILSDVGLTSDQVDWFIPHQANQRIMEGVAKKLDLATHKMVSTVDRHANTSAASIPLALNHVVEEGRLKNGDILLHGAIDPGWSGGPVLSAGVRKCT